MIILPLVVALTVTVGHVMGQPPPPVPLACQLDTSCFSNYEIAVIGNDPCKAAQDFKACTMSVQETCTGVIPENIANEMAKAVAAVKEKCEIEVFPACASICLPYETSAEADWADSRDEQGCDQYQLYRTCLQNFENEGNCNVTSYLAEANTREKNTCNDVCYQKYSGCTSRLSQLANDATKSQELCQEWTKCKKYDYSVCGETLTLNFDTKCAPTSEPPLTPPPIPTAATEVPACASTCPPYESRAEAEWSESKQKSGCDQYQMYRTCLQKFEDAGNCYVTNVLKRAIIRQNENCDRTCSEIYNDCSKYLPLLADDDSKQNETCQLWNLCNGYDFSPCQKNLTFKYEAQCENDVSGVIANFGLVAAMFSFLLL